jgi:hypothetical protein
MSGGAKALIEAVHAELLIDIQHLADEVHKLQLQLPAITADINGSAEGVKVAAGKALADFEAMGHGLVQVVRRQVEEERVASAKANAEAARATKSALEQFTKYFWLLCGLTCVNTLLVAAILLSR